MAESAFEALVHGLAGDVVLDAVVNGADAVALVAMISDSEMVPVGAIGSDRSVLVVAHSLDNVAVVVHLALVGRCTVQVLQDATVRRAFLVLSAGRGARDVLPSLSNGLLGYWIRNVVIAYGRHLGTGVINLRVVYPRPHQVSHASADCLVGRLHFPTSAKTVIATLLHAILALGRVAGIIVCIWLFFADTNVTEAFLIIRN
jgi:hypothetical protein